MTTYLRKKYEKAFATGLEFWTSEDGSLLSIAIFPHTDWRRRLVFNNPHIFKKEKFDRHQSKRRYASQEWVGEEFFDGGTRQRGKVWRIGDEKTEFPVIEYELKKPR